MQNITLTAATSIFLRAAFLWIVVSILGACATRLYHPQEVEGSGFLDRKITQKQEQLTVTVAVPDAEETRLLTGLDLYDQGIQPIWVNVENDSDEHLRLVIWSIDRDYFSPIELAYMNRKGYSKVGYADMERWFYEHAMPRYIPPGESRSGLVFTHFKPGTKGFNLDIVKDQGGYNFTFFVPMPGFVPDYRRVDFENLYPPEEMRHLTQAQLKEILENELGCCTSDRAGEQLGGPVNAVIVEPGAALRRALLRGNWIETSATGDSNLPIIQLAREQHLFGRNPDAIFTQHREQGNVSIILQFWMAPWTVESEQVWLSQVFYWDGEESLVLEAFGKDLVNDNPLLAFFVRESVVADIDSAQRYLFQNFWYSGSMRKWGFVNGVGESTMDDPRVTFGGAAYFTSGERLVVFLSEDPVALNDAELIFSFTPAPVVQAVTP